MIDKVYVLNLPHRTDRKFYMLGHLQTIGVPTDRIHFFPAKYHGDFESAEAILEEAKADGFPEFESDRYRDFCKKEDGKFAIACNWGMACIWRNIIEDNTTSICMIDDAFLTINFEYLAQVIDCLWNRYSPFYFLQLGWWVSSSTDRWMMEFGLKHRPYAEEDIVNGFIAKGTGGFGNIATVATPEGAEILLNNLKDPFGHGNELIMGSLAHPDQDKTGMFHAIEPLATHMPVDWPQDSILPPENTHHDGKSLRA